MTNQVFDIIYFSLYLTSILLSFLSAPKTIPGLWYLRIMLVSGLVNEICCDWVEKQKMDRNIVHYFYIPFEFVMLILFYSSLSKDNRFIRKSLYLTALLFLIAAAIISHFYHHWLGYPTVIYLASCLLNTIWIPNILLQLHVSYFEKDIPSPAIMILFTLFLFYVGVFVFNSMYSYLLNEETELAQHLRHLINYNLNYFLFAGLSFAFILSGRNYHSSATLSVTTN